MKIYRKIVLDMVSGELLHEDWYEYDGPVELCDRAAQAQAKSVAGAAGTMQGQLEGEGQAIQSKLTPQLEAELTASHSMNPTQINELLTAAGAGAGGATGAFNEQASLDAARTRNTGGLTASLDSAARGRQQALAKASEGIGAMDVQGALANKQSALSQLGQMGQADTSGALSALGLQDQAIGTEVQAGKSGWFQNMTGMIDSLSGAAKAAAGLGYQPGK